MNKITIIGNLTRDPEMNTTNNGKTVCNFTVAVTRRKQQNQEHPEADFFRVAAWNTIAENCGRFLQKGSKVAVVGAVQTRSYKDSNGEPKSSLEIPFADEVEFLSSPKQVQTEQTSNEPTPVHTDELPF